MTAPTPKPTKFKTIAIVGKPDGSNLADPLNTLHALLKKRGVEIRMDARTAEYAKHRPATVLPMEQLFKDADLAIAVGGDGTLLGIARLVADHHVPLVGINFGRLGFLTDIPADAIKQMVDALLDGEYTTEKRVMLDAEVRRASKKRFTTVFKAIALNDVVFSRGAMGSMIEFSVEVNGEFVYSLRADGLIIATPTGSTAYALSAGGPILHPDLAAISLVPISPHTMSNRPIVIPSNSSVTIRLIRGLNARINFDVQSFFDPEADDIVTIKMHHARLTLLHPEGYHYFSMLRSKLHWNERTT